MSIHTELLHAKIVDSVSHLNVADSICTISGNYFDYNNPEGSYVDIYDIAHASAKICRFTGHTKGDEIYSVAQHCVHASYLVPEWYALQALLHEIAEPFVGDMNTPLKRMMPEYKKLERRIEATLFPRFGISLPLHPSIKEADLVMLATEKRDLMPRPQDDWHMLKGVQPLPGTIIPWSVRTSRLAFLKRFNELTGAAHEHLRVDVGDVRLGSGLR